MRIGRFFLSMTVTGVVLASVAACTSSSTGGTPTAATTATVTATGSATSAAPPTGSGVAASPSATTGTTANSTGSGTAASGPGLCTPTVMTFRVGRAEGAAGTSYFPVIATNASKQPCVTTGYPGVAMLNAAGTQIAQATRTEGGTGGTTIVVQPGQQVSALVAAAGMGSGGSSCPVAPALLFTLPDNTDSTKLVTDSPACSDGVNISPLVRGTTGR